MESDDDELTRGYGKESLAGPDEDGLFFGPNNVVLDTRYLLRLIDLQRAATSGDHNSGGFAARLDEEINRLIAGMPDYPTH